MAFAQEVKEFLAGYKTTREMGQADEAGDLARDKMEQDKAYEDAMLELKRQELDIQRQRVAQAGAGGSSGPTPFQIEDQAMQRGRYEADMAKARADLAAAEQAARTSAYDAYATPAPGAGTGQALPTPAAPMPAQDPAAAEFDQILAPAMAEGGLVPRALDWMRGVDRANPSSANPDRMPDNVGTVVPGPEQDTPPTTALPAPVTAAPTAPTAPAQPTTAESPTPPPAPGGTGSPTRNEVNPEAIHIVVSRGREAAAAGLDALEKGFAAPRAAIDTGTTPEGDPLKPGITLQEVEQMRATVDPNGEMSSNLRSLATNAEAYTYFKNRGELDKAANAAKHYMLAERNASQMQGVLALNALQEGNVAQACQLINNACERFPTAHEINVTPGQNGLVNYSVEEAGKVLEQGTVSTQQLMEMTGQIADGSLFMTSLVNFVESTQPPEQAKPSQAISTFSQAYSAAAVANQAYEDSKADNPEGDPALKTAAQAAAAEAIKARDRALDFGSSMSDLTAAVRMNDGLAPPPAAGTEPPPITPPGNATPPAPAAARPRAQNPQTGETVEWDGKQWVPVNE
jgi:hypothetical protein